MAVETEPTSDSICTEDFVRRFRDEMVEMAAVADCSVQQLDSRQEAERTEISERDPDQRTALKTSAGPKTVDCSRSKEPRGRGEPEECLSDSYGENASESEKAGVRGRYGTPQRTGGLDGSKFYFSYSFFERQRAVKQARNTLTNVYVNLIIITFYLKTENLFPCFS